MKKILCLFLIFALPAAAQTPPQPFGLWVQGVEAEARAVGISDATLQEAFANIWPNERIIKLDRKQPEGQMTLEEYLSKTVTPLRIKQGKQKLEQHRALLEQVTAAYGVEPEVIVALWGKETNYGSNTGGFDLIEALSTLAYDGRRSDFFRKELLQALLILQEGHISRAAFQGSWAGAMGQCQFMPSSFFTFAVDGDGDGKRDIWQNLPDVFASIANYLAESGWQQGSGFTLADGIESPNDKALLKWNKSRYFAIGVAQLATALKE